MEINNFDEIKSVHFILNFLHSNIFYFSYCCIYRFEGQSIILTNAIKQKSTLGKPKQTKTKTNIQNNFKRNAFITNSISKSFFYLKIFFPLLHFFLSFLLQLQLVKVEHKNVWNDGTLVFTSSTYSYINVHFKNKCMYVVQIWIFAICMRMTMMMTKCIQFR